MAERDVWPLPPFLQGSWFLLVVLRRGKRSQSGAVKKASVMEHVCGFSGSLLKGNFSLGTRLLTPLTPSNCQSVPWVPARMPCLEEMLVMWHEAGFFTGGLLRAFQDQRHTQDQRHNLGTPRFFSPSVHSQAPECLQDHSVQGLGGGPPCGVTTRPSMSWTPPCWVLARSHPCPVLPVVIRAPIIGLPAGVCGACQYHFVDGFTRLSKALQKAPFKKSAQPFVKVPLNYSPK